jgi:Fur family transcriptional regulator, ferric uptake regulator
MKTDTAAGIAGILRENTYKLTPQRRAVLDVISGTHDHLTPQAIYERVKEKYPAIGLVTIYRTLEILADLNLVCRVHAEDNCRSYLVRRPSVHHHHLVCLSCGKVIDVTMCNLNELEQRLSRETGFKIEGHLLEFSGQCRTCMGRGKTVRGKQVKKA